MSRDKILKTLFVENRGKIISLGLLLILVLILHLGQVLWTEPKLQDSAQQLLQLQSELRLAQKRVTEGGGIKVSSLADDLEKFYAIVPGKAGLGGFIGRLYGYAETAGIDIAQISYTPKPLEGAHLLEYQLGFGVSGSYTQVKKFIHQLENSPSVLIVKSIALSRQDTSGAGVVALRIELQTFFREEGS